MLITLIIIAVVCWIAGFFINGFCLYNVLLIIPTVMFAIRKFGIHIKYSTIIGVEILFLFFSISYRLLFHNFHIVALLLCILVRAVFLVICIYDDTVYVYVNEERKRV